MFFFNVLCCEINDIVYTPNVQIYIKHLCNMQNNFYMQSNNILLVLKFIQNQITLNKFELDTRYIKYINMKIDTYDASETECYAHSLVTKWDTPLHMYSIIYFPDHIHYNRHHHYHSTINMDLLHRCLLL